MSHAVCRSGTGRSPSRTMLAACGAAAALALLGPAALAAAPEQGPRFSLRRLAPGVYAAIDRDGRAGANAGFVIGDDGVVVVDSFQFPEAAESLLVEIRRLTPLPVRYVINTHYHIDHVAGDGVFKRAGALVVAQRNVLAWIHTENLKFFGADQPEQRALVLSLPTPDLLVDRELTIRLGARYLEVRALPGHTGGDLIVAVPDARVLFCGDLVWRRMAPSLIDATVSKWTETLKGLQHRADAAAYTYVPGQGDLAGLADIGEFERYLEDLTGTVRAAMGSGARGDDLVATALPPLRARYGTWGLFQGGAQREIPFMAAELSGTKRLPPAQPGAPEVRSQGNPVSDTFRRFAERHGRFIVAAAEVFPAERYGYKPSAGQRTFAELVLHIRNDNRVTCGAIGGKEAGTEDQLTPAEPKEKLVAALKRSVAFCDAALAGVTDARVTDSVVYYGHPGLRVHALIGLVEDWADHYSQQAQYLRLNGLLPPSARKE